MRYIPATHVAAFTSFARATSRATKKAALLLSSVAVLLAGGAAAVCGQTALDGFDPNANGAVRVIVVQPDGKILIGGDFTTLSPNGGVAVTRNRIARLNPDGTLDTAFNPNANSGVYAIAVQADGKILAGGLFNGANSIGGQTRNYIARLDATTGLADSFDPNANGNVLSIAVQADGKILAGGQQFTAIGGQPRNRIARLDATTGLADSFNPNANSTVFEIVVQADGKILAGGTFNGANSIGGQTRNRIARLDATTGLADSFNPNSNDTVFSIAVQADGKVLAGGDFTTIGGQTRNYIARLDATTGLADSFDPNANSGVYSIAVQADGKILAGGFFTNIGGQPRNRIARLDATTGLADAFDPNSNDTVLSIAVQADGKVLAGGLFTTITANGGATFFRNRILRLETDGSLDKPFNLSIFGTAVFATAVQPDGKILIGGSFTAVFGQARNRIARLNTDGTVDTAFNPNATGTVNAIAVQADGKILVGGDFNGANSIGGQARNRIARLDAITGLADSFNPNANNSVNAIAVQADGKILAGGDFNGANSIGGQPRNRIARLDATTGLADSFNPNANAAVNAIVVQADGKILAGGGFFGANSIGGQTRNRIARLDATTGLADSFDPNANLSVRAIAVQADGKILAGGAFNGANSIGGQPRNRIARLDATTGAADLFNPNANAPVNTIAVQADGKILAGGGFNGANSIGGQARNRIARLDATTGAADSFDPNANSDVLSIAVRADGKILAGGQFDAIGGQTRNLFARLTNDTAALQNLGVTQTTVTWTRGGSSPQFTRVTFEYSTDNVNYTPLGNGTAAGSNWTLTGLSLSTGLNFYIRARGYYRSGYQTGSESLTESVWNAFVAGPPPPTIQFSQMSYSKPENGPSTNITVTRSGDISGTSSVNFGTGNNGYVACNVIIGSAVQNCDFILSSGTLNFAAGQTSRTFPVIINDDTYLEGPETLNLTLSNPVGATLGILNTATLTIIDNDSAGAPSPGPKTFVAALSSAQEVPPTGTTGKGGGVVQLDGSETGAQVGLIFSTLSSGQTDAHIHGPAAVGVNGPIVFPLPLGTVIDGSISPTAQQVLDLKAGLHYFNVHTTNFTGGEIRGQLLWNPLNEPVYLVTQHYYDFLGRLPDPGGLNFWLNELTVCGTSVQCLRDRSVGVSNAFFYEQEYQQTASFVFLLYRAAYGNAQPFPNPDPANPAEANKLPRYLTFVRDRAQVVGGSELAATQQALANAFVQRQEFVTKYPLSLATGAQFVDAVLATIQSASGVTLAAADRNALITHFNNGGRGLVMFHLANDYWNGCDRLNPPQSAPCVPAGFGAAVDNRVFIDAEYNRSFVYSQYSGYFRRDADIGGFLFWLNQVSQAPPRNVTKQHAMVCAQITSGEYQFRFGDKAPRTNAECIP